MTPERSADDIPFAEVFPILLFVLLFTLTTAAEGLYEALDGHVPMRCLFWSGWQRG